MFNKYYIFNEDTDNKLKELGFELNKDTLTYEWYVMIVIE